MKWQAQVLTALAAFVLTSNMEADVSPITVTTRGTYPLPFAVSFQKGSFTWSESAFADRLPLVIMGKRILVPVDRKLPDDGLAIGRDHFNDKVLIFDFAKNEFRLSDSSAVPVKDNSSAVLMPFRWNELGAEVNVTTAEGSRVVTITSRNHRSLFFSDSNLDPAKIPLAVRPFPNTPGPEIAISVGPKVIRVPSRIYEGKTYVFLPDLGCEQVLLDTKRMNITFIWPNEKSLSQKQQ